MPSPLDVLVALLLVSVGWSICGRLARAVDEGLWA